MSKRAFLNAMGVEVYRLRPEQGTEDQTVVNSESSPDSDQPMIDFNREVPSENHAQDTSGQSVPMTESLAQVGMQELHQIASSCERCSLSRTRNSVVFGSGSETANLMFIGEGPGAEEDRQGLPFVGRAGNLLTSMITALGLNRDDVYICNVVKCRPPNNRDPLPVEAKACTPYLRRQIELIRPKVIVALGRVSAQLLLDTEMPLGTLRRQTYKFMDTQIDLVVTYHPAYLLRKPTEKAKSWEDLWNVRVLLNDS